MRTSNARDDDSHPRDDDGDDDAHRPPPRLAAICFWNIVTESAFPIAVLFELAIVSHATGRNGLAAYAAVSATFAYMINLVNFCVTVTMSLVGNAVGRRAWRELGFRVGVALAAAVAASCVCAALLYALEEPVYRLMGLSAEVAATARTFYAIRLASVLPLLLRRVCTGVLGGYQRYVPLATLSVGVAALELASNYVALVPLAGGLPAATWASCLTAAVGAAVALLVVVCLPPEDARGQIRIRLRFGDDGSRDMLGGDGGGATARLLADVPVDADDAANDEQTSPPQGAAAILREYVAASGSMVVRSFLLSTSVWALGVAAANLGAAALGAHAVVLQLWMVTSYICDGFADAGTMLGAKLLGEKAHGRLLQLCNRLVAYGVVTGVVCGVGIWVAKPALFRLYFPAGAAGTAAAEERREECALLSRVWPLLCGMQVVNAAVFVYDGLIYATKSFAYVRNVMLGGCLGVFAPLLATAFVEGHTLLWIWAAKAVLNGWRLVWAVRLIHVVFRRQWVEGLEGDSDR